MLNDEKISKKLWAGMVLLSIVVAFSFQGSRGLYESTEGRYAECAREMMETGNYFEPTLNYQPHWSKPPLTYWAIIGGMKLLGVNEWGVRFYNAIAFFLTVLVVTSIGTSLWGRQTGLIAGLIYTSSPFTVIAANTLNTDTLLTLWQILAVMCYIKACKNTQPAHQRKWIFGMWIFWGLGFLTKGFPALLPLLAILVWHFQRKRQPGIANPLSLVLFLLVGFSWYVIVSLRHSGLLSYWLKEELVGRTVLDTFHRNPAWYVPFKMFLPVLIFGAGPWLYFGLKTFLKEHLYSPRKVWNIFPNDGSKSFLFLWFLIPLVILFLVKSRLPLYVLPLYAPLALATARGISKSEQDRKTMQRVTVVALVTCLALIAGKGLYTYYPAHRDMKLLYEISKKSMKNNSQVVAFKKSKMFGLQFYLNGKLQRVSDTGQELWADASLNDMIRTIKDSIHSTSYVFISEKRDAAQLHTALKNAHLRLRYRETDYWVVLLIENST